MTTPDLLSQCGAQCTLIVRKTEYKAYQATAGRHRLLVIGKDDGLNAAREAARQTLRKGEWAVHMDDNVLGFIAPKASFYKVHEEIAPTKAELELARTRYKPGTAPVLTRKRWQPTMNVPLDFKAFYELIVEDALKEASSRSANLVGFSAHENPQLRARKHSDVGYVCGKMMLMRNTGLPWVQSKESSGEDYALSAAFLYDDGRVLINKWGHPLRKHYMAGGCGSYEERLPAMLSAQRELTTRYGALFGIKNANAPDKKQGELRIRFHTLEQVAAWRLGLPDPNYRVGVAGKLVRPK
jgi:hypothetical protein